jgi:hypothetical protein
MVNLRRASKVLIGLLVVAPSGCASESDARAIAIEGATVVDVVAGTLLSDHTVLVRGGRIEQVAPSPDVSVPADAERVDARGTFIIPGLWDMHAHVPQNDTILRMYLQHGVTGLREMGTSIDRALGRRAEMAAGRWTGPRVVSPVLYIDGVDGYREAGSTLNPTTAEEAVAAVDSLVVLKADFVKILGYLPRPAYVALVEAARRRGLTVAGHWPGDVPLDTLLQSPPRSIEHLFGGSTSCLFDGVERCAMMSARFAPERLDTVASGLARADIWVTPTLVNQRRRAFRGDSAFTADSRLAMIPRHIFDRWASDTVWSRPVAPIVRSTFDREVATIPRLQEAGVRFLAGTDGPAEYLYAGASLHDELVLFVEAGMTTINALRSATSGPATFLGAGDSLGTVATGKLADLVLLDGDPLADIRNVRRVRGVMMGGRWVRGL